MTQPPRHPLAWMGTKENQDCWLWCRFQGLGLASKSLSAKIISSQRHSHNNRNPCPVSPLKFIVSEDNVHYSATLRSARYHCRRGLGAHAPFSCFSAKLPFFSSNRITRKSSLAVCTQELPSSRKVPSRGFFLQMYFQNSHYPEEERQFGHSGF